MSDGAKAFVIAFLTAAFILGSMAYGARDASPQDWANFLRTMTVAGLVFGAPIIIGLTIFGVGKLIITGIEITMPRKKSR